jgi:hypothetical protein
MILGDKKQVTILGVVALLAIGFLVTQLIPKGSKFIASVDAEPAKQAAEVESVSLPLEVSGNPFSHAKLAPEEDENAENGLEGGIEPLAPDLEGLEVNSAEYMATLWQHEQNKKPDENAGETRKEEEKAPFNLKLTGFAGGTSPMAFIEVRGRSGVPFEEGDQLEQGVYLLRIRDESIDVRIGKKVISLALNEELNK